MITVYKYALPIRPFFELELPKGFAPLSLEKQRNFLQLWLLLDTGARIVKARFTLRGTGESCDGLTPRHYIASAQFDELVFHLFHAEGSPHVRW